jgi:hypothetical protein
MSKIQSTENSSRISPTLGEAARRSQSAKETAVLDATIEAATESLKLTEAALEKVMEFHEKGLDAVVRRVAMRYRQRHGLRDSSVETIDVLARCQAMLNDFSSSAGSLPGSSAE